MALGHHHPHHHPMAIPVAPPVPPVTWRFSPSPSRVFDYMEGASPSPNKTNLHQQQQMQQFELFEQVKQQLKEFHQMQQKRQQGIINNNTTEVIAETATQIGECRTLQLGGVTLDSSSSDELTSCRPLRYGRRKDAESFDSGIQGSASDLLEAIPVTVRDTEDEEDFLPLPIPKESTSEREIISRLEPNKSALHGVPPASIIATKSVSSISDGGETFNLVEEVYVVEDPRTRLQRAKESLSETHEPPIIEVHEPMDAEVGGEVSKMSSSSGSEVSYPPASPAQCESFVVVAIDFGTTYSGYAYTFTRDPENHVHMMRKWEGGDPGLNNQKTPTALLLTPEEEFHSFGFSARDFYHDLEPQEAKRWLFFDKFKMSLHYDMDVRRESQLRASNGHQVPALKVFALSLRHLKEQALRELSDQAGCRLPADEVRWVLTVPAIWRQPAKQLMREAAYQAGICDPNNPAGLLIALEPESAAIFCRQLRVHQLVQERRSAWASASSLAGVENVDGDLILDENKENLRYMVVDCGGGTVDITVHELNDNCGTLRELHKATGGPWGSVGVDMQFEKILEGIFGHEFMTQFKLKRPAAYVELMLSFEARKRSATTSRDLPLNIFPPFAFIDYYRKYKGKEVDHAVKKYGRKDITWSSQGMLRLQPSVMLELFKPTIGKIIQHIENVLINSRVEGIQYLFLVGGFSESQILQHEVREAFQDKVKVIIPQGVSLAILKGAVMFGLNPRLVTVRRAKYTYGVGVLKRFVHGVHPPSKLIKKDGVEWCADVLDRFVSAGQPVCLGETVVRRYAPARHSQVAIVINIYCVDNENAQFISEAGVRQCGTLELDLTECSAEPRRVGRREIHARMVFGGTEVEASALDITTGRSVNVRVDFLTSS